MIFVWGDFAPQKSVYWCLFSRYDWNHFRGIALSPEKESFCLRMAWFIVSKALDRSGPTTAPKMKEIQKVIQKLSLGQKVCGRRRRNQRRRTNRYKNMKSPPIYRGSLRNSPPDRCPRPAKTASVQQNNCLCWSERPAISSGFWKFTFPKYCSKDVSKFKTV